MPKIPESVIYPPLPGFKLIRRGKVRDTYALDEKHLLVFTTDRLSIFDFVLPAVVPQKGEALNALNVFWANKIGGATVVFQDAADAGHAVDSLLPKETNHNHGLQKRAAIVRKLEMKPVECIARGYLTGSGWKAYQETAPDHCVCGHSLPPGLKDGDKLPRTIFTPTTKAEEGHDEHMPAAEADKRYGPELGQRTIELYEFVRELALKRGIILADTKLEFGSDPDGILTLGDERFTPDSSRYWLLKDWERSREKGTSPASLDKQFVRNWGKTQGIDKLDPKNPEHVAQVHGLKVPEDIILWTRQIYRYIFWLLTGQRLEKFQTCPMGIPGSKAKLPPVEIVLGSQSDAPQIEAGIEELAGLGVPYRVHVVSCHRNPEALRQYAETGAPSDATIIAAAGKAAALPGVLQAWLRHFKRDYIHVLGVGMESKEGEYPNIAARISIDELPGRPVVLQENGRAYFGAEGFVQACRDAALKEFFLPPSKPKEAVMNLMVSVEK